MTKETYELEIGSVENGGVDISNIDPDDIVEGRHIFYKVYLKGVISSKKAVAILKIFEDDILSQLTTKEE